MTGAKALHEWHALPDDSADLARRIADELGLDWLWVEEAVRRRHRILFSEYSGISHVEYEALRDSIKADLMEARR